MVEGKRWLLRSSESEGCSYILRALVVSCSELKVNATEGGREFRRRCKGVRHAQRLSCIPFTSSETELELLSRPRLSSPRGPRFSLSSLLPSCLVSQHGSTGFVTRTRPPTSALRCCRLLRRQQNQSRLQQRFLCRMRRRRRRCHPPPQRTGHSGCACIKVSTRSRLHDGLTTTFNQDRSRANRSFFRRADLASLLFSTTSTLTSS